MSALWLTYSEVGAIAGHEEEGAEGAMNARTARCTNSKGCAAAGGRSWSTAVQIGPVAPRVFWRDRLDVEHRLRGLAPSLARAAPPCPPKCEDPTKLKRLLTDAELPHFLWVWGPEPECGHGQSQPLEPKLYVRKLPIRAQDLDVGSWTGPRARVAHLRMSSDPAGSKGGHSTTCRADFVFDETRSRWSRKRTCAAVVIAKTARPLVDSRGKKRPHREYQEDLRMLQNEAEIYDAFPPSLMGCKEAQYGDSCCFWRSTRTYLVDDPGSALVPKFYGFYVPYEAEPGVAATSLNGPCSRRRPETSPILLMEDCGKEIRTHKQTDRERLQVQESLMARLHDAGFTQGSYRSRNFVVEYGPSGADANDGENAPRCPPHYRIIDFGRGSSKTVLQEEHESEVVGQVLFERYLEKDRAQMKSAWREMLREEDRKASDSSSEDCEDAMI